MVERLYASGISIILAAILAGGLFGCKTSLPSDPPDADPTDSVLIAGVVKDSVGLVVPDAIVEIVGLNSEVAAVDTSDDDGSVSFAEPFTHPQQLSVHVRHPDFKPFSQNVAAAIDASANSRNLQFRLESGTGSCVRIPVEVVYQRGNGSSYELAIGAEVRLFSQGKLRSKAIFDSSGVYFTSLPVGEFRLEIRKPGFRFGDNDFVLAHCGIYLIAFQIYPE